MKIVSAEFVTSVANMNNILRGDVPEIAFVGRSNVGKSSLLNRIVNKKNLAKTSSTPGRTRLINYFLVNGNIHFVDLPGYGFAKAGLSNKEMWAGLIEEYLLTSKNLSLVFVLVDIRHEPTDLDKQMLKFLYYNQIPFKIIATKSDKIARSKIGGNVQMLASALKVGKEDIIPFSSQEEKNIDVIFDNIENSLLIEENGENE